MGEAVRAAERKARIKTRKEKQRQSSLRCFAVTLSVLFVLLSVTIVFLVMSPPGTVVIGGFDARRFLDLAYDTFPVPLMPFHTLIVTLINTCSPVIIKVL